MCADRQVSVVEPATPLPQELPPWHGSGLGAPRFVRHYYGDSICSSGYVRCFSWPGALRPLKRPVLIDRDERVAPLGDRGLIACSPLPHAYRSVATSVIGTTRPGIRRLPLVSRGRRACISDAARVNARSRKPRADGRRIPGPHPQTKPPERTVPCPPKEARVFCSSAPRMTAGKAARSKGASPDARPFPYPPVIREADAGRPPGMDGRGRVTATQRRRHL
jgi:hypothetical protein